MRKGLKCRKLTAPDNDFGSGGRARAWSPVIRLFGTGVSFASRRTGAVAWVWFQITTSPTASSGSLPMGTVVVSGCRSANATWTSWYSWVPLSTVSAPAAPNAAGNEWNGLIRLPGLVILVSSALMNTRWSCSRCRSWVANRCRVRTKPRACAPSRFWQPFFRCSPDAGSFEVGRDAHAHPADRVHHADQAAEADAHVVVDLQAGGVLHRLGQQLGPAEVERGVDLVHAEAGDVHVRVTRDADQHRGQPVAGDVQDHDGVRPVPADAPSRWPAGALPSWSAPGGCPSR